VKAIALTAPLGCVVIIALLAAPIVTVNANVCVADPLALVAVIV
jgi:hypothetical protein